MSLENLTHQLTAAQDPAARRQIALQIIQTAGDSGFDSHDRSGEIVFGAAEALLATSPEPNQLLDIGEQISNLTYRYNAQYPPSDDTTWRWIELGARVSHARGQVGEAFERAAMLVGAGKASPALQPIISMPDWKVWAEGTYGLYPWRVNAVSGALEVVLPHMQVEGGAQHEHGVGSTMRGMGAQTMAPIRRKPAGGSFAVVQFNVTDQDRAAIAVALGATDETITRVPWSSTIADPNEAFALLLAQTRKASLEQLHAALAIEFAKFDTGNVQGVLSGGALAFAQSVCCLRNDGQVAINESWGEAMSQRIAVLSGGAVSIHNAPDMVPNLPFPHAIALAIVRGPQRYMLGISTDGQVGQTGIG